MGRVAITGAGIVGAMCAATLARRGVSVTLIDSFDPMQQVSSAAFGSLTPFSDPFFTGALSLLAARGVELHKEWRSVLAEATGLPLHCGPTGLIHLFDAATEAEAKGLKVKQACESDDACRVVTKAEVLKLEPNLRDTFAEALIYEEPWIDLEHLRSALSSFVLSHPDIKFVKARCTSVEHDAKHAKVHLDDGSVLPFDHVIVCTGLTLPTGIRERHFTMSGVRGDVVLVRGPEGALRHHVYWKETFLTPRADGRILVGSTYEPETGPLDPLPATDQIDTIVRGQLMAGLLSLLKGSDVFPMIREWRHWRPKLIGRGPAIGPIASGSRVLVALGFVGLGVTLAPAVAELISDLITKGDDRIPKECRAY